MPGPYLLGRVRPSPRRLAALPRFAAVQARLPDPPASADYTSDGAAWAGSMGNDTAGDCTIAGVGHLIQGWGAATGRPTPIGKAQAIAAYSALSGYNPATGANDTGLVETDVLDHWQQSGFWGNRLAGYSFVDPTNAIHVKQSIWCFGGAYFGLELPGYAVKRTDRGEPWTLFPLHQLMPMAGGHCVVGQKYDDEYLYVDTWGGEQAVAWDFVSYYFDAAYALVNPLWIGDGGIAPNGLDLAGLMSDLPAVAG